MDIHSKFILPRNADGSGVTGSMTGFISRSYMRFFHTESCCKQAISSTIGRPDKKWLLLSSCGALNPMVAGSDHIRSPHL